jgi:hypothetical protein
MVENSKYKTVFEILGGEQGLTVIRGCNFGRDIPGFPARFDRITLQEAFKGYAIKDCSNWSGYMGDVYLDITVDEKNCRIIAQCHTPGCQDSNGC